ncbi:YesK family protein [Paenibacillus kandeliae]|uniref:YesK family protein n=1 Tax=Paenibacillus kandeliae TaxID=3231269 RepID=UPI00345B3E01
MGAWLLAGGTAVVLLLVSIILSVRNRNSRNIQFIPGLIGVLVGALLLLFSLFQSGWEGLGYLIMAVLVILGSLATLFIMLVVGKRIAGQR